MKIGLTLFIIVLLLAINPMTLLSVWVFTSPVMSNFIHRSLFYSVFASKRIWDYEKLIKHGFGVSELMEYDRIILTLLFFTVLISRGYSKLKFGKIDYCFFILLSVFFISSAFSNNQLHSIRIVVDTFGLSYMAYFLGKNLIQDRPKFLTFINSVILLACSLIIIGLIEWKFVGAGYRQRTWPDLTFEVYRITGPFRYWESMGTILSITLFMLFYKFRTVYPTFRIKRTLLISLIILNCFCIFLTQTRTAIFAVVAGILVSAYKGRYLK